MCTRQGTFAEESKESLDMNLAHISHARREVLTGLRHDYRLMPAQAGASHETFLHLHDMDGTTTRVP